jgi:subtilisin-like proprotein convertase family protein
MSKKTWYSLSLLLLIPLITFAQDNNHYWHEKAESQIPPTGTRVINPTVYRTIALDTTALKNIIEQAPSEALTAAKNSNTILTVPLPDGTSADFKIVRYDMMAPELSAEFPVIKTGYGISTGKTLASIRFDWTYRGFHAFIRTDHHTIFIDPYSFGDKVHYVSYFKKDYPSPETPFVCHVETSGSGTDMDITAPVEKSGDCVLREYRLAMATTGQYSNYHGASNASQANLVLSAVVTTMNRVNGVYEQDVTIRMVLIANTVDVFYYNGATDPYSNNNVSAMLGENQSNLNNVIGFSNYDIGHVFGTGGGGIASLFSPCTGSKARGVTGLSNPVGDPFDIDYVAHEMGHQWGANHTQNNNCNRNNSTAMEPGSASTIMGYAGICSPNIQANSDAYFHGINVQEMNNFIVNGNGNNCDEPDLTFINNAPSVSAGGNYTIPKSTPFVLTATGSDADGDPITYCWEQWDNEVGNTMPPSEFNTQGPVFRSFFPSSSPKRYFPRLEDLVNNVSPTWEVLPAAPRNMEFRVTARDLRGTVGCTDEDNMNITVNAGSGPFLVTNPSDPVTWTEGENQTITWNVAGTDEGPVSCANVDILLSYDGGFTYPVTLASGVTNNGSRVITVPTGTTISARVMVICSDNIFFDISNNNFTIEEATIPDYTISASPSSFKACGNENAIYNIDIDAILNYNFPVSLSVSGLPFGASSSFSSNPVSPGNSTNLIISNLSGVAGGTYTITIQAASITGSKFVNVSLTVLPLPESITLFLPADNETDVLLLPTFIWQTDPNASYYQIQVATDPAFSNVVLNTTSLGSDYTMANELDPNTMYFWRVKGWNDTCEGSWSSVRSFLTLPCKTYFSGTDVPLPAFGTANSIINIPETGDVTDINVGFISGTHTYVGDLTFTLSGPDNTQVFLLSNECDGEDDFNLGFDDESDLTIIPCPPTSGGIYQPVGNLSDFDNGSINGNWTLRINDNTQGDGGLLDEWELRVCATNSNLLPVDLTAFSATALDRSILLSWTTAIEFNNAGFEIQRRSSFETEFKTIGWTTGKGTTEQKTDYTFEDDKAIAGVVYYYRLRQLDFDGKETYSDIKSALIEQEDQRYIVYPNPVNHILNIQLLDNSALGSSLILMDIRGSILLESTIDANQTTLNLDVYPSGLYILKIDDQQHRLVKD